MPVLSTLRASLIALLVSLLALAGAAFTSAAYADSGGISFSVIKAGFVIGGSGGSGTLTFRAGSTGSGSAA
jgi:lipid-binding SYLF domain-containing protein